VKVLLTWAPEGLKFGENRLWSWLHWSSKVGYFGVSLNHAVLEEVSSSKAPLVLRDVLNLLVACQRMATNCQSLVEMFFRSTGDRCSVQTLRVFILLLISVVTALCAKI